LPKRTGCTADSVTLCRQPVATIQGRFAKSPQPLFTKRGYIYCRPFLRQAQVRLSVRIHISGQTEDAVFTTVSASTAEGGVQKKKGSRGWCHNSSQNYMVPQVGIEPTRGCPVMY
ncbi:MAG: hypothetical protein OEY26_05130, partial [Nitrospinota bacterium]|nr:hypothetical protein [Nitrospinota bacterium]